MLLTVLVTKGVKSLALSLSGQIVTTLRPHLPGDGVDIGWIGVSEHRDDGTVRHVRDRPDALLVAVDQVIEHIHARLVAVRRLQKRGG
ncbi:hypothetical protein JOL79_25700 [Microbispora sp. RL4-1S]|uniref:Uncharacterized protein n=1 Tax=Microbispora oryzae TaxID=2806554 RepID=A0A940WUG9_9ACTN|nr:hypothetical protein [Microbispora oryzae]MBP2707184.1 hypothetical protein [Microbispora oryzae]